LLARHFQDRIQIENLILAYEMNAFSVQAHKMRTILAILVAYAGINAEQVCIRTVNALPQGDAKLWYGQMTGVADGKEVFARHIVFAALDLFRFFKIAKNATTHENVGCRIAIRFYFIKALIYPLNAILAVDHLNVAWISFWWIG
jgi:hypothetical protein